MNDPKGDGDGDGNKDKDKGKRNKGKKGSRSLKKSKIEIEEDILNVIANNDELMLKISTFQTMKFEQMEDLCWKNNIKISKDHLKKFLDEQGICFSLPDNGDNGKKKGGPRRVRRGRRK